MFVPNVSGILPLSSLKNGGFRLRSLKVEGRSCKEVGLRNALLRSKGAKVTWEEGLFFVGKG